MKNLIVLSLFFLPLIIIAQNSGRIIYKEIVQIEIPEEIKNNPEYQDVLSNLPEAAITEKELLFYERKSIYKNIEGHENPLFDIPDSHYFLDLEADESLHMMDFFGDDFLISGRHQEIVWKLTEREKRINGYLCLEAVAGDSTDLITAWFAPEISTSAAPMFLIGLSGLIMEATMKNGTMTLMATDIMLGNIEEVDIVKPSKGRNVTNDEFLEIVNTRNEGIEKEKYVEEGTVLYVD